MIIMVGAFVSLMLIVGCGVFFLSWRDSGGAKKSAGTEERRKSADSGEATRAKKTLRPSKLEPPNDSQATGGGESKSGSGDGTEGPSMQRRSSYKERRSKSQDRSPSEGEAAKAKPGASPGARRSSRKEPASSAAAESTPAAAPAAPAAPTPEAAGADSVEPRASSYRARREASRSRDKAPPPKADDLDF